MHSRSAAFFGATIAALGATIALAGCGMPGAPMPPSLNLPIPVNDLSAVRTGGQVALTWTMPAKTTDKVLLKGSITVRICRNESAASRCSLVATLQLAPKSDASFTDTLPSPLAAGSPRVLSYFVELVNRKGRSAGLSNSAAILAGEAPPAIENLTAQMRKDGVLLHWAPTPTESSPVAVRLVRRLLSPPAKKSNAGPLAQPAEPLEQTLLVEAPGPVDHAPDSGPDASIDNNIRFGETYEYRAQRVARITVGGSTLELAGPLSAPLRIDAINLFPPSAPKGLAAVATAGENGFAAAIDLSWLPSAESNLAGYIVYRRDSETSAWQRISPAQPVVGPGYHDPNVQLGHNYSYAVTAIDQDGLESARSAEASDTVPGS
ncbi:MAG TPA: fibronectin type III domain-containing protein [Acidobacteriaceae bacterium]